MKEILIPAHTPEKNDKNLSLGEMVEQNLPQIKDKDKAYKAAEEFRFPYKPNNDLINSVQALSKAMYRKVSNENLRIDGHYDFHKLSKDQQIAMVYQYQKLAGITQDGILGPETKQSLKKDAIEMNDRTIAMHKLKDQVVEQTKIEITDLEGKVLDSETGATEIVLDRVDESVAKTVNIPDIPKSEFAKRAEKGVDFGSKKPVSAEELKKSIDKVEARAERRREIAYLKKLKDRLKINIDGGTPESARKSKELLKEIDTALSIVERDMKILDKGDRSLDEYLLAEGNKYTVSMLKEKAKDIGVE